MNRSSTVRTYSQRQDAEWEHFAQTELVSPVRHACAGFQDSSPVKSPMRKKSTFQESFHHDDDYQFALAVQESFKTLPPEFNVEEFERSQPIVGGEINPLKSTLAGEQLMQATSANTTTQANNLNLDTLATAVSLFEKLPLE